MAADLSTCKTLTWATKATKGCANAFPKSAVMKRHGIALVGHLIYLAGVGRQNGVYVLDTNALVWKEICQEESFETNGQQPTLVGDKLYSFGTSTLQTSSNHPVRRFDLLLYKGEPCRCKDPSKVPFDKYAGEYVEVLGLVVLYGGNDRLQRGILT